MNIINKIALSLGVVAAGSIATSCDSFLKEHSQDLAMVQSWEDLDEILIGDTYIKSGYLYIANSMVQRNADQSYDIVHLMADELDYDSSVSPNYGNIYLPQYFGIWTWQREPATDDKFNYVGGDAVYFNTLYTRINKCNMVLSVIDEQPEPKEYDRVNKLRVKGEAYFLRAYFFFTLANLYCEPYAPSTASQKAGIVLKTSEFVEDVEFENSTLTATYEQILADLEQAEAALDGIEHKSLYRADHVAVNMLQSRVYLYMQNWEKAAEYAQKVLDQKSGLLDLRTVQPRANSIYAASPESIFSMGENYISAYISPDSWGDQPLLISEYITSLYDEDTDLRVGRYFGKSIRNTSGCYLKYDQQRDHWTSSYNEVGSVFFMRTPEAYLTLAEASAFMGKEDVAKSTLERYLPTRMTGNVSVNQTGKELIDFIREERAREFLLEGHRWFDLRRYTVCEPYKWSKEITHLYAYSNSYGRITSVDSYTLSEFDGAYTLSLPQSVTNFQNTLNSYTRPDRVRTTIK